MVVRGGHHKLGKNSPKEEIINLIILWILKDVNDLDKLP